MITFDHVTKKYETTVALNNVSFEIADGEVFGLIGHNGAGKSTTIKSLVSVIEPTSGTITIDGKPLSVNDLELKSKIAYVPDSPDLFLNLSAGEYWDLIRAAYNIPNDEAEAKIQELMAFYQLEGKRNHLIQSFSHGMRQKVLLIGALLSHPKIWVMDEPMTGLDPQAIFDLKQQIKQHAAAGNIVIFSSHDLNTAQELCDHIVILKHGEISYDGTLKDLRAQHQNASLEDIYLNMDKRVDDSITNEKSNKDNEVGEES